ncbi:OmpA family protein [Nonlabens sp. Ci31]|jgi:outer membrane protein OmpA-like peptidoglycan-associated protein|uniref:OmpA family protein n=1 Tax=Nonlabens sp. Ci31 TaxID=2608253 RepID=UPI001462EFC8|nr:OmpA family protein [Nonlabens sp. Ci31]QJP33811.1 OmpA family protein [Nonlabens sp. Ci31]
MTSKKYIAFLLFLVSFAMNGQLTETHSVYFDLDKDQFPFSEGKQLNAFFDDLIYKPLLDVKILGYCDDQGSYEYNLDLSNRRVETVSKWLQEHAITIEHISKTIEGRGEVALEDDDDKLTVEDERAQNRRVDVVFSLKETISQRLEIKKLNIKDLTEEEEEEIKTYEKKAVKAVLQNTTSTALIPASKNFKTVTEETMVEVVEEYLDIPTKLDTIVDNSTEPFKSLLNKNLKKGQIIRLENILFYRGRSVVLEESQPLLDRVAEILVAREDIHFEIHGHVCCINPVYDDAYNRDTRKSNLSYDRAKSIFETLKKRGVSYRRMKYKGFGRTKPLGGIDKLDRRVELYITKIDKD